MGRILKRKKRASQIEAPQDVAALRVLGII
jgi:hypothetical protein